MTGSRFAYKAVAADGRTKSGRIEAAGRAQALAALREQGLNAFEIERVAAGPGSIWTRDLFGRDRVSDAHRIAFLKEFATLLGAGLTVDRALRLSERQAPPVMKPVLGSMLEQVLAGTALSRAMANQGAAFPAELVAAIRAGESTGRLVDVLATVVSAMERQDAARRHLRSALVYPALLVVMAIGTVALLVGVLVPSLAPLFDGSGRPAPFAVRVSLALGDIWSAGWPVILGGAGLLGFALARAWPRPAFAAWRARTALRVPLLRDIVVGADLGRVCRILGTLLAADVPIPDAIRAVAVLPRNRVIRAALEAAGARIATGSSVAASLVDLRPHAPSTLTLVATGEHVNRLPDVLLRAADMHDQQTRQRVDAALSLVTPLVTVVIGGLIGGLIVSVMGAILSVGDLAR